MDTNEKKSRTWWVVLIEGIAALITGVLLLASPERTMVVMVSFLGLFFLVAGLIEAVSIFVNHEKWLLKLVIGILGVIAGILIMRHPLWSTVLVTSVLIFGLGIYALIAGISKVYRSIRGDGWGVAVTGVIAILIGIFLLANRVIGIELTVTIVGIVLVVGGIAAIVMSFRIDDTSQQTPTL